jgi:hypothetical protein
VIEKRYRATALGYRLDSTIGAGLDDGSLRKVIGSMFDIGKAELGRAMDNGLQLAAQQTTATALRLEQLRLSPDRQRELVRRLVEVLEEFEVDDDAADGTFITLLAAFPSDPPAHPRQ